MNEEILEATDNWDSIIDDEMGEEPSAETAEVDEQEETTEREDSVAETSEEPTEEVKDTTYTIRVLGEDREVSADEYKVYAQKGADYDGLKADRDRLRAEIKQHELHEDFLNTLAKDMGVSVEEVIDQTNASMLAKKENISEELALERVKHARELRELKANNVTDERNAQFAAFAQKHPELKPQDIPKSVWEKVNDGMDISIAYELNEVSSLKAELKALKEENETLKQESSNRERSTGSRKSSSPNKSTDLWEDAWEEALKG